LPRSGRETVFLLIWWINASYITGKYHFWLYWANSEFRPQKSRQM